MKVLPVMALKLGFQHNLRWQLFWAIMLLDPCSSAGPEPGMAEDVRGEPGTLDKVIRGQESQASLRPATEHTALGVIHLGSLKDACIYCGKEDFEEGEDDENPEPRTLVYCCA